jgi:hypothetical protein
VTAVKAASVGQQEPVVRRCIRLTSCWTSPVTLIVTGLLAGACVAPPLLDPNPTIAVQEVSAEAHGDGITVEFTLDRQAVAIGDRVRAFVRVVNGGTSSPIWESNICGWGPAPMTVTRPWDMPAGRAWQGIAADFKRTVLEQGGYLDGEELVLGTFWDARALDDPDPMSCPAVSQERPFEPEEVAEMELAWHVVPRRGQLLMAGPATVTATFTSSAGAITAQAPIDISGGPPPSGWTIIDAIDAALQDEKFSAWLSERPTTTWLNTSVAFWPNEEGEYPPLPQYEGAYRGAAEVGLARSVGALNEYGAVIVEWGTWRVLGNRFEP